MKTSDIKITVGLDENNVPDKLLWTAQDGGIEQEEAKAMLLSVWDSKAKETLRIDLWTKDMPVDEMKQFFHQTLVAMADTFQRATADEKMSDTMRDFCDYFAEKLELNTNLNMTDRGTILTFENLKEEWTSLDIRRLKRELAKFVSPIRTRIEEKNGFKYSFIQDVIDQLHQQLVIHLDHIVVRHTFLIRISKSHQFRETGNRIQRSPDLMAHIRQIFRFHLISGLSLHLRLLKA